MLRTLVLLLVAGSLGSAATIGYDVAIDTSVTGPRASVLLSLFDNDPGVATSLSVTNVDGIVKNGWALKTGNVTGSFAENDTLVINDGAPSFQYVNGYLELFATFESILKFTITFTTEQLPNADIALFGMRGGNGLVVDLFAFDSAGLTVLDKTFVSASPIKVSVPEPSAVAELLLLLGFLVGVGIIRQRQSALDRSGMSRAPHFG